jgi:hypothetical protein
MKLNFKLSPLFVVLKIYILLGNYPAYVVVPSSELTLKMGQTVSPEEDDHF